jgi:hypothetical protein
LGYPGSIGCADLAGNIWITMKTWLPLTIAILSGLLILAGFLVVTPALQVSTSLLLSWAVILAAVALMVAVLNLVFRVHWVRISRNHSQKIYSAVLIASFIFTFILGLLAKPGENNYQNVVSHLMVPFEATLTAILLVSLIATAIHLLQKRRDLASILFFVSTLVFLLLASGLPALAGQSNLLKQLLSSIQLIPAAGLRGLLIGVAIGNLIAGLRILTGSSHPYSE